jgi:ribonucleoside-diphosphate reductase alpha chain
VRWSKAARDGRGLSRNPAEAIGFCRLMSSLAYLPSSPTLFNSGTRHTQMSSCFLADSPKDELDSIYERYHPRAVHRSVVVSALA